MTKLPVVSGKKMVKILIKIGFNFIDQESSHIKLRREYNGEIQTIIVPDHREIRRGTLKNILRMADLSIEDFQKLL